MKKGTISLSITVIVAFFVTTLLLAIGANFVSNTASYLPNQASEVQANRIVNSAAALDSMNEGSITLSVENSRLRYNSEGPTVEISSGSETISASASILVDSYDVINAPRTFRPIRGDLTLLKEVEDGEEVLTIGGGSG